MCSTLAGELDLNSSLLLQVGQELLGLEGWLEILDEDGGLGT